MVKTLDMLHIGAAVAAALGPEWSAHGQADNPRWTTLRQDETDRQFGIGLYHDAREKRIRVHPCWPMGIDGAEFPYHFERPDCSITVSESRTPEAIAREIERRFLPTYREAFARGAAQRDEHNAYTDRQSENLKAFAELLGGSVRGETVSVQMGPEVDRKGYIHGFQVGGNSVQWDFRSMPPDVARKVLEYWKSL